MRTFFALLLALWALASAAPASAQVAVIPGVQVPAANGNSQAFYPVGAFRFLNITTNATTVVKSGSGVFHTLTINTSGVSGTITMYDNTAASGTKIGTITLPAAAGAPVSLRYDVAFQNGLTIVTGVAASDLTVTYQ